MTIGAFFFVTLSLALPIPGGVIVDGDVLTGGALPVENARVTLFTPSLEFFREDRTDAAGHWQLEDIPPGNYQLGVAARDLEYVERPVEVTPEDLDEFLTIVSLGQVDVLINALVCVEISHSPVRQNCRRRTRIIQN